MSGHLDKIRSHVERSTVQYIYDLILSCFVLGRELPLYEVVD